MIITQEKLNNGAKRRKQCQKMRKKGENNFREHIPIIHIRKKKESKNKGITS